MFDANFCVIPVGQDAEGPFVQVHDRVVDALVPVDDGVSVEADNEVFPQFCALLQKILNRLNFKKDFILH